MTKQEFITQPYTQLQQRQQLARFAQLAPQHKALIKAFKQYTSEWQKISCAHELLTGISYGQRFISKQTPDSFYLLVFSQGQTSISFLAYISAVADGFKLCRCKGGYIFVLAFKPA